MTGCRLTKFSISHVVAAAVRRPWRLLRTLHRRVGHHHLRVPRTSARSDSLHDSKVHGTTRRERNAGEILELFWQHQSAGPQDRQGVVLRGTRQRIPHRRRTSKVLLPNRILQSAPLRCPCEKTALSRLHGTTGQKRQLLQAAIPVCPQLCIVNTYERIVVPRSFLVAVAVVPKSNIELTFKRITNPSPGTAR